MPPPSQKSLVIHRVPLVAFGSATSCPTLLYYSDESQPLFGPHALERAEEQDKIPAINHDFKVALGMRASRGHGAEGFPCADGKNRPAQAIEDLLIKERLDLAPPLRTLDGHLENVELALRKCLVETLGDAVGALPGNLIIKADERIQREARKNPLFDEAGYQTLGRKLEYFDLREIEAVIVNGALWPRFEARFANKVVLAQKFNQLAELRNSIRHSRSVTEIMRMEGEAAILWFREVLNSGVRS